MFGTVKKLLFLNYQFYIMKNLSIEFKWAFNFSIATLLWMIFEKSIGLHDAHIGQHLLYSNFFAVIAIAIYFFALLDKKKNFYKGNIDWKQGFISGLLLSFFIALMSPLVQYITFTYITPKFFQNFTAYAVLKKSLTLTQAQAYYSMNSYILQGVSGALSMGVITAAIVALIIKTKTTKP